MPHLRFRAVASALIKCAGFAKLRELEIKFYLGMFRKEFSEYRSADSAQCRRRLEAVIVGEVECADVQACVGGSRGALELCARDLGNLCRVFLIIDSYL